jgi:hypothetical protein
MALRKGTILDIIPMLVVLTALVFTLWIFGLTYSQIQIGFVNATNNTVLNPPAAYYEALQAPTDAVSTAIDFIPLLLIGQLVVALILAFLIPTSPIFLPLGILMLAVMVVESALVSNVLWDFINLSTFAAITNAHPVVVAIIQYLPYITAIYGGLLLIITYGSKGSTSGQI